MGFHGDNGYARWITNSDWDTYAHGNLYTDGYCHSYSCTHSNTFTNSNGHSYSCTNGDSDTHSSTHTDPNSYYYASTNSDTNANTRYWPGGCLQFRCGQWNDGNGCVRRWHNWYPSGSDVDHRRQIRRCTEFQWIEQLC